MQGMRTIMFAVGWLLLFMVHPATLQFDEEDVLEAPQNVTVGVGDPPLELICRMKRDNVYMEIDDIIVGLDNRDDYLCGRGFMLMGQEHNLTFGVSTQRVVMELTEGNNNTKVVCLAADDAESSRSRVDIVTPDVFITIIGVPSIPSLQYSVNNDGTLEVAWDEPYAPVNHSVISYYIRVTDTYQAWISLLYDQLDPDTRSVRVTQMDPDSCSNLTMEVWAENTFGNSTAGEINGAFPARPQDFQDPATTLVTFSQDFSPILHINFTFPVLCPYNDATYVIEIADADQNPVHTIGPGLHHWMDSGSSISMVLSNISLEIDAEYTLNITVWNSVGRVSDVSTFSTIASPDVDITLPTTVSPPAGNSGSMVKVAASSIGGAAVVVFSMLASIIAQ